MTQEKFEIRAGTRRDAPEASRLWMRSAREHAAYDPIFEVSPHAESVMHRYLAELASSKHTFLFVALSEGRMVGFASGEIREGSPAFSPRTWASIDDIFVLPEYRNLGLGTSLLQHCSQWAHNRGANGISLQVAAGNARARSLYNRLGFREVSVYEVLEFTPEVSETE